MHTYISLYLFKICTYPKTKVTKRLCEGTYTQGSSSWVHAEVKTSFEDKCWHLWQVICIPEPRFPHLWNGDRAYLSGFQGGQNKMMYVEFLVKRWAWDKWQSLCIKNWVDTAETDPEPYGQSWEKRGPLAGLQRTRFWIWEGGSAPGTMWCTRRKMKWGWQYQRAHVLGTRRKYRGRETENYTKCLLLRFWLLYENYRGQLQEVIAAR